MKTSVTIYVHIYYYLSPTATAARPFINNDVVVVVEILSVRAKRFIFL